MTKINYLDPKFKEIILSSPNCSSALKSLGLQAKGGNFATIKQKVYKLGINIDHWSNGRNWNKGLQLKSWENYSTVACIKKHLIKILGHKCENCLISIWYDFPICLEVHHIDGDRTNNKLENLQLLCPNCHSMTDNWRGKKNAPGQIPTDTLRILSPLPLAVGLRERKIKIKKEKIIKPKKEKPPKTPYIPPTKTNWPDTLTLEKMISSQSIRSIAKQLGVSDNAVRYMAKRRGIDISKISMWSQKYGDCSSKWRKS